MCVLSIKVPIQKKSGNLFDDTHTSNPSILQITMNVSRREYITNQELNVILSKYQ